MTNWNTIESSICHLEEVLDINVTIVDRNGILHRDDGYPFFSQRRQTHQKNEICKLGFCDKCITYCRHQMNEKGEICGHFFVGKCWKGVMEIVVPMTYRGIHFGSFFAGTWREPGQTLPANKHLLPEPALLEYGSLPALNHEYAEKLGGILTLFVQGMLSSLDATRLLSSLHPGRRSKINQFICKHASSAVNLKDLASELNLSPSRTSHLVKELYGFSFQELLKQERLKRAKTLLLSSGDTIREIANRVGITDEYHFNKLFKKDVGVPPGKFRNLHP